MVPAQIARHAATQKHRDAVHDVNIQIAQADLLHPTTSTSPQAGNDPLVSNCGTTDYNTDDVEPKKAPPLAVPSIAIPNTLPPPPLDTQPTDYHVDIVPGMHPPTYQQGDVAQALSKLQQSLNTPTDNLDLLADDEEDASGASFKLDEEDLAHMRRLMESMMSSSDCSYAPWPSKNVSSVQYVVPTCTHCDLDFPHISDHEHPTPSCLCLVFEDSVGLGKGNGCTKCSIL
jgi:hypothetical protein